MKFLILLLATAAQAHYTFPHLVEVKDWLVTRTTKNAQSKAGVTNVASPDIRYYQAQTAPSVATVPAGATIHYVASQQVNHPGPTQYWDGAGAVWFKFYTEMPLQNLYQTANATIPAATPSGDYLLRVEQITLHLAQTADGA